MYERAGERDVMNGLSARNRVSLVAGLAFPRQLEEDGSQPESGDKHHDQPGRDYADE
jgi:hypothetical protein